MDKAEADRIRQLSRALRSFPLGRFEQVLPYAFAVVDAGLWECFISRKIVSFLTSRRQRMTTGSARYILTWREGADNFAEIQIRTVGEEATHIAIIPGTFARQNHLDEPNGIIEATLEIFIGWLNKDQLRMIEALEEEKRSEEEIDALWRPKDEDVLKEQLSQYIAASPTPHKHGSHISWPEDDWAWEQVNTHNRPRNVVRIEWLRALSPTRRQLSNAADSFRKAVNPKRKADSLSDM